MGRTNKLVDGCYSFWQGGLFPLLQRLWPDYLAQTRIPGAPVHQHGLCIAIHQWNPISRAAAPLPVSTGTDAHARHIALACTHVLIYLGNGPVAQSAACSMAGFIA